LARKPDQIKAKQRRQPLSEIHNRVDGVDHRHRRRQFLGRLMMIDDDDIQTDLVRRRDLARIRYAAIDGDHQSDAAPFELSKSLAVEAIAVVDAMGHMIDRRRADLA
jgi:hypothetical protein